MKRSIYIGILILLVGCGENSDGSSKNTYSSCSIISSKALLASDRARDVSQCWDGVNYREKSLAMDWCSKNVNSYMGKYNLGHDVEYQATSTNCPKKTNNVPSSEPVTNNNTPPSQPETSSNRSESVNYSIKITLESVKSNGSNWDAFGGKPDIKIYIDNEYKGLSENTFECRVNHTSHKDKLYFKIYDKDVVSDDFVGSGFCPVNEICQLGQAVVKIYSN